MGVHGLWKLIESTGQVVPLESLAGKVLAVDISIWLHQAVKGMQDAHGAPMAVAHLLILFHRLCKLLFYKIKPVFVFDGGVPLLKSQVMATRRHRSNAAKSEALKVREKLIKNLLKHEAVRQMLSSETASAALGLNSFTLPGPSIEEDLYKLPPIASDFVDSECSDALSSSDEDCEKSAEDIHSIDVTSQDFLSLPAKVRHDLLTELIETRKQSSWKYLDRMPRQSETFSEFQMNRLLKRHAVQTSLEKAGKEIGGRALSLKELETLLGDQGVLDPKIELPSRRIAQDSTTHYMLVQRDADGPSEIDKFNVMDHLEDVEWSSESDTDIILQNHRNKKKSQIMTSEDQEKSKTFSVCKPLKGEIKKEITDILSVLEDPADLKVQLEKTSLTNINLNFNSLKDKSTESERDTKVNNQNVINDIENKIFAKKDSCLPDHVVLDEKNFEVSSPVIIFTHMENNKCHDKISEKSVIEIETVNTKEFDSQIEQPSVESATEKVPLGTIGIKETANSCSDSENDFLPIMAAEIESPVSEIEEKKPNEPSRSVLPGIGGSLTVLINPSEITEKNDIFADVFKLVPDELKKAQVPRREGIDETTAKNETVNECKTELDQQVSVSDLRKTLEKEQSELLKEKGRQERHAMNLTDQIYTDAQELLRLFGIPFVVAPMEAEAQCATLNVIGLTEGTITDDSDIWLFGGRVVYKNFFNQNKHVLEYRSENIEKSFKLTREELIKMALLVGSDYTVGLNGIGPVTALEIIASFQTPNRGALETLIKFRDWFTGAAKGEPSRVTLRKKIRNTVMSPGFPSKAVIEAYLNPQVDNSKEPFSWAKPNLDLIHKYVKAKMGWSTEKCNEVLLPVLKKLEEKTKQTTIDKHFKIKQKPSITGGILSKRVENAVKRLGNNSIESGDPNPQKKRKSSNASHVRKSTNVEALATADEPRNRESEGPFRNSLKNEADKLKLIREKLHKNIKVPQREMAQKLLKEKKKEAIKIFRTYKKAGKKKTKVFAKEEANLSESSSEND